MEQKVYLSKQVEVKAIQWDKSMGAVFGVRNKPKKHVFNPDHFYVVDRFGKETQPNDGDWILQRPDGSYEVCEIGAFNDLWMLKGGQAGTEQPVDPGDQNDNVKEPQATPDPQPEQPASERTSSGRRRRKAKKVAGDE